MSTAVGAWREFQLAQAHRVVFGTLLARALDSGAVHRRDARAHVALFEVVGLDGYVAALARHTSVAKGARS